jgi:uncharacterized membrane protein
MAFTRKAGIRSKQLASTMTVGETVFLQLLVAYVMTRKPADTIPDLINFTVAAREAMLNTLEP